MSSPAESRFPLADADLCVKCGLCLPHCPTYQISQDEGDSPRGRIALMQGLVTGLIGSSTRLETHLDGCLACRACEAVCPAEVPYGRLIDAGRAELARQQPSRSRLTRWMGTVLTHAVLRRGLGWVLWLYQISGLQHLIRTGRVLGRGRLSRLESLLPPLTRPAGWQPLYPAIGDCHGRVALFIGCVSDLAERQALLDSITLLNRLGYEVQVPSSQTCCGALHQHNGMPTRAQSLAARNLSAFDQEAMAIVGTSSGCSATLREYDQLLPAASTKDFTARVQDISRFLVEARGWERLRFRPLAQTVAVHEPCTLRNVLKTSTAVYALLSKIPELRVQALADNARCCGAAGSYFLTEPDTADQLAAKKLMAIAQSKPDWLVSSNVGCALHIGAALRRSGHPLRVLHPVSLLVRQLEPAPAVDS